MDTYRNSTYNNRSSRKPPRRNLSSSGDWLNILLFYILPFIIVNVIIFFCVTTRPKCTITLADTNDYLTTKVTMTVDSWFPTKTISLTLDSEPLEMEKGRKRTYTATLYKNGVLEANIVNLNGMSITMFEHVDILDEIPPSIESSSVEDGVVTVVFQDSQSGVNPDTIYALDSNDVALAPSNLDKATNTATFDMDPAGLRIFAQDKAGNEVQATFTSRKEGDNEILEGGEIDSEEGEEDPVIVTE